MWRRLTGRVRRGGRLCCRGCGGEGTARFNSRNVGSGEGLEAAHPLAPPRRRPGPRSRAHGNSGVVLACSHLRYWAPAFAGEVKEWSAGGDGPPLRFS